mgnify:CR=1 FL=1
MEFLIEIFIEITEPDGGLSRAYTRALEIGFNNVNSMISSIPETVYNVFALPQNIAASLTGNESWSTDSDQFKKDFDVENKLLTHYDEEIEKLSKDQESFKQRKFGNKAGVYENFKEGNVTEGFTLLGLVFSAISNKALANVYKDIIKKEGIETGAKVFKDGIVKMYSTALKKYGAGAGMIGEGIEEVATQMTQNAFKGKDITEGAADAFLL